MRNYLKLRIIVVFSLTIILAALPIISKILILTGRTSNNRSVYNDRIYLDNENLKLSKISGRIHIDNNWSDAETAGICTGFGTYSEPYIIEDFVIDGGGSGSCILIENSDEFFKIENCTVYNSGSAGIMLYNVKNSQLVNNNFTSNRRGIRLSYSNNNTISGNTATYSFESGIFLYFSDNNKIVNNSWSGGRFGISLHLCRNITISTNKMNDCGLSLYGYLSLNSITADITNLVNGKPVYYYNNKTNLGSDNFTNAGQVILYNCHNSSIENLNTSYGSNGISLDNCNNNNITGNVVIHNKNNGIDLSECYNNNIWKNTIEYNTYCGIDLYQCYNNLISKNNVSYNLDGISTQQCDRNNISRNKFYANRLSGIYLYDSDYNNISGNTANNNNHYGIHFLSSNHNIVSGNTLLGNIKCILEMDCEGNIFENNECVDRFPVDLIDLFIAISIISGSAVIGAVILLLIIRKRKRIE